MAWASAWTAGRLEFAGHDDRPAAMRLQILGDGRDPLGLRSDRPARPACPPAPTAAARAARKSFDIRGPDRQPVLGLRPRQRRRALDHVEPIHLLRVVGDAAAIGEIPRVAHHRGPEPEEIGVERDDDVGLVEVVDRVARRAGRLAEAQPSAIGRDWIVLMPRGLRVFLQNRREELRRATAR